MSARIDRLAPFLEGMVTLAWATATFWFPLMIAIGVWRHIVRRVPLRYHPSYWALVFPLGMYGAATFRMRAALQLEVLGLAPEGHPRRRPPRLDRDLRRARPPRPVHRGEGTAAGGGATCVTRQR